PKENRDIPPLNYAWVYRLKRELPTLEIIINGGIRDLDACASHLDHVDGVMLGREAYQNPWVLAQVDSRFYGTADPVQTPLQVIDSMLAYVDSEVAAGVALKHITRHMLGLFAGRPGARRYRRYLSERAHRPGADVQVLHNAVRTLQDLAA
ncbi:MAG: tRNA-dihydrouridine synthase, partial [Chromatocurvus sp.]